MFRLALLIIALTYIPEPSPATTLADKLDKLYEKLEKLTVPPPSQSIMELTERFADHYAKLEESNNLGALEDLPEDGLTEDEEAILSGIEAWGGVSAPQIIRLMKEIQEIRHEKTDDVLDKNSIQIAKFGEGSDDEAGEDDDEMQDIASLDYAMDAEDADDTWDADELPPATTADAGGAAGAARPGRPPPAADPAAATAERPRVLDDSSLSTAERMEVRRAALASVERAVRGDKCLLPQPRWLCIRQLAPAADTIYMPPCVVLHRCAVDSGCCYNDAETCGPVAGEHVAMPLYLSKADGNLIAARMLFYNHTRCSCISRDGEGQRDAARPRTESPRLSADTQPAPSSAGGPSSVAPSTYVPVTEPHTAPPELRRCTCPTLFLSQALPNGGCACTCRWGESGRRRECLSLARGREHFGIRDRRCVIRGQCSPPDCEYGPYERAAGRCPPRPHRRLRSRYRKTVQT